MSRSVSEWIGKNDDAAVPSRVKLRIWEKQKGICGLTGVKINADDKKHLHHIKALILGGEHRETNLAWVLASANAEEAKREVAEKAKVAAVAKKHLGIKSDKKSPLAGRTQEEKNAAKAPPSGRLGLPARKRDVFGRPI